VVELVRRAQIDLQSFSIAKPSRSAASGLDGPARESANDQALMAAGIGPGHSSLYPTSLRDLYPNRPDLKAKALVANETLEQGNPIDSAHKAG
jgi:hypothetical protein